MALWLLLAVVLAGCIPFTLRGGDDPEATVSCTILYTPYGKGSRILMRLDKETVTAGTVVCDDACKCTMTLTPHHYQPE